MRSLSRLLLFLAAVLSLQASPERDATIVLYNRNDPESRDLAKYYAEKRGISFKRVLGLDCSNEEEISRDHYVLKIEAPLRELFTQRNWWRIERNQDGNRIVVESQIRFVAIIRGVPLKIRSSGEPAPVVAHIQPGSPIGRLLTHNEASVDSELSAMFSLLEEYPAILGNPYYRRFVSILDVPPSQAPLLVTRLDAPTAETVRNMIDNSLRVEREGLWGWAYIDSRGIRDGGLKEGDDWMLELDRLFRKAGVPVIADFSPNILPSGYPVEQAAAYYGWYIDRVAGPFERDSFRFVPGAVAAHIHSFSAATLRNPDAYWVAPLVTRGVAATVGNVYEPYLSLTTNLDVFQDRLMTGLTLAEAAYASLKALSWMNITVGDPLYRPYAAWTESSGESGSADSPFATYRRIVRDKGGDPVAAAEYLRAEAARSGNSMFLEALGQAYASDRKFPEAIRTLNEAQAMAGKASTRFRIALEKIEIHRRSRDLAAARRAVASALGTFTGETERAILDGLALELAPAQ